uniref:Uncharacterized protein n=1 Tax=Phlebotomus papatasi TaxID=29031 RepID=A0A1B0DJE1_PHLPP
MDIYHIVTVDYFFLGGNPLCSAAVARTFANWNAGGSSRRGRQSQLPTLDPLITRSALLKAYSAANSSLHLFLSHLYLFGETMKIPLDIRHPMHHAIKNLPMEFSCANCRWQFSLRACQKEVTITSAGTPEIVSFALQKKITGMIMAFFSVIQIFAVLFIITHYKYTEAVQQLWPGTIGQDKCTSGRGLKYISGDALTDSPNCIGPNSAPYPR